MHRFGATETGTYPAHAFHDCREVYAYIDRRVPGIVLGVTHVSIQVRRADQSLRRGTTDIHAGAADKLALDQCNLRADRRCAVSRGKSRRTGADDHQGIRICRLRVAPSSRMEIFESLAF